MGKLTISKEHYLKAVYELFPEGGGVRISDIAAKLNVTKASSCIAMKNLEQKRMIYRDAGRLVFLTKEGEYQAVLVLDKVAIIRKFLTDVLGIRHEIADADACAIVHVVSVETLCSLCRFTNRKCPGSCHMKTDTSPNRLINSYLL
ncbi:metal-dependent transcriptional regulator [Desulfoscipio sp. XC116]|uniref:metal-dependent transcriptional regulator n=1 Tax=Desulfoscipio sp. XC116 TaxID=3144975 RepID=UPI00325A8A98